MDDPDSAAIDPDIRNKDRVELEKIVLPRAESFEEDDHLWVVSQAKAELLRRDRQYAEEQEESRRSFETALADKQLSAATDVANATRWAMWAAFAAAFGAIIQAVVAVASFYR